MHARSAVIEMSSDRIDDAVERFKDESLPRYREVAGYKGFTLLVDRQHGKVLGVSLWETEAGIVASDQIGREARDRIADSSDGSAQTPDEWEVAVHEST